MPSPYTLYIMTDCCGLIHQFGKPGAVEAPTYPSKEVIDSIFAKLATHHAGLRAASIIISYANSSTMRIHTALDPLSGITRAEWKETVTETIRQTFSVNTILAAPGENN